MAATEKPAKAGTGSTAAGSAAARTPAKRPAAAPRTRRAAAAKVAVATHDAIAHRAYELHLAGHGDELANWLQAERELNPAA